MSKQPTICPAKGMLFSAAMVKTLLDDSKSQTRRLVKPAPNANGYVFTDDSICDDCGDIHSLRTRKCKCGCTLMKRREVHISKSMDICPHPPGSLIWVKETFRIISRLATEYCVLYEADGKEATIDVGWEGPTPKLDAKIHEDKWTPSIFMPRWASRITLEVTKVRVARLQDISEGDAQAEGTAPDASFDGDTYAFRTGYVQLWESIHGKGSWDTNPWVWVYELLDAHHP